MSRPLLLASLAVAACTPEQPHVDELVVGGERDTAAEFGYFATVSASSGTGPKWRASCARCGRARRRTLAMSW